MSTPRRRAVGVLLLGAGALILLGIITAETQYPGDLGYTTAKNEISDLGATGPRTASSPILRATSSTQRCS